MKKVANYLKQAVFVTRKEIPQGIIQWVTSKIGNIQKYEVKQATKVNVDIPAFENDRVYYALFELTGNDAKITSMQFERSGLFDPGSKFVKGSGDIPSGYVMVEVSRYLKSATIYTSGDATKFLAPTQHQLSDEELLILHFADSLISSARPVFKDNSLYASLIGKGLLKGNKAITVNGKNALEMFHTQLKKIDKKDYLDRYGDGRSDIFSKNENEVNSGIGSRS